MYRNSYKLHNPTALDNRSIKTVLFFTLKKSPEKKQLPRFKNILKYNTSNI